MTKHLFPLAILLLAPAFTQAQARPDCVLKPTTLTQMRRCYRPLLVFSPSATDSRLIQQQSTLDEAADDMLDRFVLFVPVFAKSTGYQPPLDTPYALLSEKELTSIRSRFQIAENQFTVLLLGEDGAIKLRSPNTVTISRLNSLIDAMPDRKLEMQRPHAN
ncbi:DUF4174 domain-containing protein [Alloacidobacterium dinghuense]|uniref:DUF4174 domain-containing protein n=1 Tax=Alloacidobacterium dinghuense TaxID=2763107 RepID=A0A7G8BJ82_9BACT|nr:DUF4174 domain-containing protein [Alloacidobacterium dinghuense]QNI32602.1 DUF4174 domain-containing protein [Alloacidobacterium dinghuense]